MRTSFGKFFTTPFTPFFKGDKAGKVFCESPSSATITDNCYGNPLWISLYENKGGGDTLNYIFGFIYRKERVMNKKVFKCKYFTFLFVVILIAVSTISYAGD